MIRYKAAPPVSSLQKPYWGMHTCFPFAPACIVKLMQVLAGQCERSMKPVEHTGDVHTPYCKTLLLVSWAVGVLVSVPLKCPV